MNSKLNGRYGVVDDAQSENRSVFSLKLTDAALGDIQDYLAKHNNGGLQICFQSNTNGPCQKGEIKFPDKSWKFSYMRTESIDAISLRTGSDYVATIGSTEANFKVDANFDQSTQNIHSKWEHKKELDAQNTTKMIEQKAVRGAKGRKQVPLIQPGGRYKQIMNNANRAQSVKQEVKQPPKNASTPPMPSGESTLRWIITINHIFSHLSPQCCPVHSFFVLFCPQSRRKMIKQEQSLCLRDLVNRAKRDLLGLV